MKKESEDEFIDGEINKIIELMEETGLINKENEKNIC